MMIAFLNAQGIGLLRTAGPLSGEKMAMHAFAFLKTNMMRQLALATFNTLPCFLTSGLSPSLTSELLNLFYIIHSNL